MDLKGGSTGALTSQMNNLWKVYKGFMNSYDLKDSKIDATLVTKEGKSPSILRSDVFGKL